MDANVRSWLQKTKQQEQKTRRKKRYLVIAMLALLSISYVVWSAFREGEEIGSPYGTAREYTLSEALFIARYALSKKGFDQEGWLLSNLHAVHGNIYRRALAKIPEDDLERDFYEGHYRIRFLQFSAKADDGKALIEASLPYLQKLSEGHSKTLFMDEVEKYQLLLNTFMTLTDYLVKNDGSYSEWAGKALDTMVEQGFHITPESFRNTGQEDGLLIPVQYYAVVSLEYQKYMRHDERILCEPRNLERLNKLLSINTMYLQRLKTFSLTDHNKALITRTVAILNQQGDETREKGYAVCRKTP